MAIFCMECGESLLDRAKFCPNCGTAIVNEPQPDETPQEHIGLEPTNDSSIEQEHQIPTRNLSSEGYPPPSENNRNKSKDINYIVMIPLAFIGCSFCSVLGFNLIDPGSFFFMMLIFPLFLLIGASVGWLFGGVISKSSLNPFANLLLTLGFIGAVYGASFGIWFAASSCRSNLSSCDNYFDDPLGGIGFLLTFTICPAILGLLFGVAIAFAARKFNASTSPTP